MWTSSEETSSSSGASPGRTPSTSARLMVAEAPADFPTSSTDLFPSLDVMTSHVSSSFGSGFWALLLAGALRIRRPEPCWWMLNFALFH